VYGLKHGALFADISAGHHAQAANQACRQIAHHIAVQIGQQQHVELLRVQHHLHAGVVDDQFFVFDVFVLLGHRANGPQEQSIAQLHDIGFMDGVNLVAPAFFGVFKGKSCDARRGFLGDDF
jgi:hypothetical protein